MNRPLLVSALADAEGGGAWLRRLDPRTRLLCVLAASLWAVLIAGTLALLLACAMALVLAWAAGLRPQALRRRLLSLNAFMLLAVLTLPFSTPGTALWQGLGLRASGEGLLQATHIALSGNLLMLLMLGLLSSIEPVTLAHALLALRVPEKLVRILMFALRYIDVLHASQQRLGLAMRARGFRLRSDLHTMRSMAMLVGCLIAHAADRALRIEQAMHCRGWRGRFPVLLHFQTAPHDLDFAAGFALVLSLLSLLP
ncbi:cobalt/nickel transport system permease protein [Solimonas aquatica]|uniref:Cobalt/nickel transport system permease protein n=1 Tax=Solimonas aquatica TaxID=489703 RepID=A0A1H9KXQ5_9GAMM|nr:cobalt ECF transporter T component CbiQ [Solimonas aquatica]SER03563.1 cobalt/nickel transport system permease protein [Solimonas aquatica]